MEKSVTLLFGIKFGGVQAGDTLNEEIDIIIDETEAFVERFSRNEEAEGVTYAQLVVGLNYAKDGLPLPNLGYNGLNTLDLVEMSSELVISIV